MKTFCVSLGLIAGCVLGSLWNSVAQSPAIAQTIRPDGSGATAGDLCDGTWEVDTTFSRTYTYRCNGTFVPALSAPAYLASRSLKQLETLSASSASIKRSVDEVKASVDGVTQAVVQLTAALQKQNVASKANSRRRLASQVDSMPTEVMKRTAAPECRRHSMEEIDRTNAASAAMR